MKNYYQILGVSDSASNEEIRSAYRRLISESITDKERFDKVKEAYEALRTPEKRAEYDLSLDSAKDLDFSSNKNNTLLLHSPIVGVGNAASNGYVCISCGYSNPRAELYCRKCGFLLKTGTDSNFTQHVSAPKNPRLVDELGRVFPLKPGVNTIGRETSDVAIAHKTVSRNHAHIVYDEDRDIYSVEDLASTNGTFLNTTRLSPHSPSPVLPGDDLQFGAYALRLVVGALSKKESEKTPPINHAHPNDEQHDISYPASKATHVLQKPLSAMALLKLVHGAGPSEASIESGQNTIGRMADNIVCIRGDRYVSGHHAVLEADQRTFRLTDLGSTNGTFLNGLRLTPNEAVAISDGDEITLGGAVYVFRRGEKSL